MRCAAALAAGEQVGAWPVADYRHQLKPVITRGAETMNTIFTQHVELKSA